MCLTFKILNLFGILSPCGSSNYRPSAPFLYEVASHVKNCHFVRLLLLLEKLDPPVTQSVSSLGGCGQRYLTVREHEKACNEVVLPDGMHAGNVATDSLHCLTHIIMDIRDELYHVLHEVVSGPLHVFKVSDI